MTLHPPMSDAELWTEAQRREKAGMGKPRTLATPPQAPTPSPVPPRGVAAAKRASTAKRKAKAPPVPLEHDEQVAFFARVFALEAAYPELQNVYAVPNFSGRLGHTTIRQSARLNAEGRRKGYPDINVDVSRHGVPGLRIEMKRQNATASDVAPEQLAWHVRLRAQGYRVEVCKGADAAWAVLLEYLGIATTMHPTLEGVTDAAA